VTNANGLTFAEQAAAWEAGREERTRAREQAIIDRLEASLAATFERLNAQYTLVAIADPPSEDALPDYVLTPGILAHAIAGALLDAGVADVSAVRDFILWEPMGRGVEFDLAGFARWAGRKAEK